MTINRSPEHNRAPKHNRRYGEEIIARIEELHWVEKKPAREIAEILGMKYGAVNNLMYENAIYQDKKPKPLPKFSGWDFSADNIEVRHG